MAKEPEYDAVLVGAGIASICTLNRLRKLGLRCHVFERAPRSGGTWYWNCYPGARVDTDEPWFQILDPDLWLSFDFKERYPDQAELLRYFDHVDATIDFSRDTEYNVKVDGARWDEQRGLWIVECAGGREVTARWFVPAVGMLSKPYIPEIKGIETFKGEIQHSAEWPQAGVEMCGKRIAVIGTGASGVQLVQTNGPEAAHLTVYQRTPNFCLPMLQRPMDAAETAQQRADGTYERELVKAMDSFGGFYFDFQDRLSTAETPEQRQKLYDRLFQQGGFHLWLNVYPDQYKDEVANRELYDFWRKKILKRIPDPAKANVLAPAMPPHPWGTKRPSLERTYYEVCSLSHVDVLDIASDPIAEITPTGIRLASGDERVFDVIALATGFDAISGGLATMNIQNHKGETIKDHWADGLRTSHGIALHGFPNMFFVYGPQATTAFSNGPSGMHVQAMWLEKAFGEFVRRKVTRIEPTAQSEVAWTHKCHEAWYGSLFCRAKSWYQGSNVPGKRIEPLNFTGGLPAYVKALDQTLEGDWADWIVTTEE